MASTTTTRFPSWSRGDAEARFAPAAIHLNPVGFDGSDVDPDPSLLDGALAEVGLGKVPSTVVEPCANTLAVPPLPGRYRLHGSSVVIRGQRCEEAGHRAPELDEQAGRRLDRGQDRGIDRWPPWLEAPFLWLAPESAVITTPTAHE